MAGQGSGFLRDAVLAPCRLSYQTSHKSATRHPGLKTTRDPIANYTHHYYLQLNWSICQGPLLGVPATANISIRPTRRGTAPIRRHARPTQRLGPPSGYPATGVMRVWCLFFVQAFKVLLFVPDSYPPSRSFSRRRSGLADQNSHRRDRGRHDGHRRLDHSPDQ